MPWTLGFLSQGPRSSGPLPWATPALRSHGHHYLPLSQSTVLINLAAAWLALEWGVMAQVWKCQLTKPRFIRPVSVRSAMDFPPQLPAWLWGLSLLYPHLGLAPPSFLALCPSVPNVVTDFLSWPSSDGLRGDTPQTAGSQIPGIVALQSPVKFACPFVHPHFASCDLGPCHLLYSCLSAGWSLQLFLFRCVGYPSPRKIKYHLYFSLPCGYIETIDINGVGALKILKFTFWVWFWYFAY